jgi:hypothetical protein
MDVPAWAVAGLRKQRVNAYFGSRLVEEYLHLAALKLGCVVEFHGTEQIGRILIGHSVLNPEIVPKIQSDKRQSSDDEYTFHAITILIFQMLFAVVKAARAFHRAPANFANRYPIASDDIA